MNQDSKNTTDAKTETKTEATKLDLSKIKAGLLAVGSDNVQFGVVDHVEGSLSVKINKDDKGVHHYIPMSWVTKVDDKLYADRSSEQVKRDWKTEAPTA